MLRQSLCSVVAAAGFYSSASVGQASQGIISKPSQAIEEAYAAIPPVLPNTQAPSQASCQPVIPTFDDAYLEYINGALGAFKSWLIENGRLDDSFAEEFFGEGELNETDRVIYEEYAALFEYEAYDAGSEAGLDYLKQDAARTLDIFRAYTEHAAAQKFMLEEMIKPKNLINIPTFQDRIDAVKLQKYFEENFLEPMADLFDSIQDGYDAEEAALLVCQHAAPSP